MSKSFRDPVCGMHANGSITLLYKGQTYMFCKDPESYITK